MLIRRDLPCCWTARPSVMSTRFVSLLCVCSASCPSPFLLPPPPPPPSHPPLVPIRVHLCIAHWQAMLKYGFPVGPMALVDEVGIQVAASVGKNLKVSPASSFPIFLIVLYCYPPSSNLHSESVFISQSLSRVFLSIALCRISNGSGRSWRARLECGPRLHGKGHRSEWVCAHR